MATFVLVHGAGDVGWYWHLTEAELRARGHQTIAPDLPCDNDTASLDDYARTVADAAAGRPVVWGTPWPLDAWPDVPTRCISGRDDHFFPAAFMRRVARQRLRIVADEVPGCHCAALSNPRELSELLASYL